MNDPHPPGTAQAIFAGGCFWCTEAVFKELEGVLEVTSGYTGGHVPNPTYEEICQGTTGHAEAVRITFDPKTIPYRELLQVFFASHDPTTLDRQGNDVGSQYRSAIFSHDAQQRREAQNVIAELTEAGTFDSAIVTQVGEGGPFYPAEEYHQDYFAKNPGSGYCRVVINPKLAKMRQRFTSRLRAPAPS